MEAIQYGVQQCRKPYKAYLPSPSATEMTAVQTAIMRKTNRHKGGQRVVIAVLDGRGQPLPLQLVIAGARSPAKWTNKSC